MGFTSSTSTPTGCPWATASTAMLWLWLRLKLSEDRSSSANSGLPKRLVWKRIFSGRLVKISPENPAQVRMGDGIAVAIRSKMKTVHPFQFLVVEDLRCQQTDRPAAGSRAPGPEMNLVRGNRPADCGGGPRQRGDHVRLAPILVQGSEAVSATRNAIRCCLGFLAVRFLPGSRSTSIPVGEVCWSEMPRHGH